MSHRVLVVDDNPNNRLTIELLLEEFEVEILSAENGEQAVTAVREQNPDLVLMDLMMPVMDGIEATRQIRTFDTRVMIVAVTALDDEGSKEQMLRFGAEDYLRKPIDPEIFTRRVHNYLELIELRASKGQAVNEEAANLFDSRVFYHVSLFHVRKKEALAEFWEHFLAGPLKQADGLSDCVRVVYALGSWLLKSGHFFRIVAEENEENLFLTLRGVESVSPTVIRNILLKHYPGGLYKIEGDRLSFRLKKGTPVAASEGEVKALSDDETAVLRMSHTDKISAQEYVEMTPIGLMDKIEALEEQEDKIDLAIVAFESHPSPQTLSAIGDELLAYNGVIDAMFEFQHLAFAIGSLINFLKRLDESSLDEKKNKKLVSLLSNVLADLSTWRKTIFVEQSTNDIHYLDSSLLSSCLQIEMIFEQKQISEEGEDDDGIEFF
jgi:two-component system chemotaxis response regulator CheY